PLPSVLPSLVPPSVLPSLPGETPTPTASTSASPLPGSSDLPTSSPVATASQPLGAGAVASSSPPSGPDGAVPAAQSPFLGLVIPGLLLGIPVIALLLIVGAQLIGGAVWLPVIRRWTNGGVLP